MLINIVLLAFNALPAFPLDGGRVLRAALWRWRGSLRWASRLSAQIGSGFGAALILLALLMLIGGNVIGAIWWFLIGIFLRHAAGLGYQQVVVRQVLQGETVRAFMTGDPITVPPSVTVQRFVDDYVYRHHLKMFPVVDGGDLVGCVTTRQVKQVPRDDWADRTVGQIAAPRSAVNPLHPDDDVLDAMNAMSRDGISRTMVVEGDRLVGVLALKDLVAFLALKLDLEASDDDSYARGLPLVRHAA